MASLLAAVASAPIVVAPVALVVAHPDDETLGLSSRLPALHRLTVIHLTDGAPRRLDDARRAGFADRVSYAAARRCELERALDTLGVAGARRVAFGHADQESIEALDAIVARLVTELDGTAAVITHPYEHGHPDHDTAALAVALACRQLASRGRLPERMEFASYHLRDGQPVYGVFWPEPACPEVVITLDAPALAAKRAALACHASQHDVVACMPLSPERLRIAPNYDFAAPAPPGSALYDRFGWDITSARWRAAATRAWAPVPAGLEQERWHPMPACAAKC